MDEEVLFEADLGQEGGPAGGHRATAITAPVSTRGLIRTLPSLDDAYRGITGSQPGVDQRVFAAGGPIPTFAPLAVPYRANAQGAFADLEQGLVERVDGTLQLK